MPEFYDRTVCVTELAIRNQILEKIDKGWLPCASFEIPNTTDNITARKLDSIVIDSPEGETSVTSTAPFLRSEVDIADLDT